MDPLTSGSDPELFFQESKDQEIVKFVKEHPEFLDDLLKYLRKQNEMWSEGHTDLQRGVIHLASEMDETRSMNWGIMQICKESRVFRAVFLDEIQKFADLSEKSVYYILNNMREVLEDDFDLLITILKSPITTNKDFVEIWKGLISLSRYYGYDYAVFKLVNAGLPIDVCDEDGNTPLMVALKEESRSMADRLSTFAANTPLINQANKMGQTPLSLALSMKEDELVDILLDDGADVNAVVDLEQNTMLHLACQEEDIELVKKLILLGANPKKKNASGKIPFNLMSTGKALPILATINSEGYSENSEEEIRGLITPKNLANFLADSFMKGMKDDEGLPLERNPISESLRFLNTLLALLSERGYNTNEPVKTQTLTLLGQLKKCQRFAQEMALIAKTSEDQVEGKVEGLSRRLIRQITSLKKEESLVIPSGWGHPTAGHSMLCVVKYSGNGRYECMVINTGIGTERHHETIQTPNKTFINPVIVFQGISRAELCETGFIQALIEPWVVYRWDDKDQNYSSKDIYQGIFSRFENKKLIAPHDLSHFITGQRSGSCSMRAPLAYLRFVLGADTYKLTNYYLKKFLFSEVLSVYGDMVDVKLVMARLLEKGAEKFCRQILKLCSSHQRRWEGLAPHVEAFSDQISEDTNILELITAFQAHMTQALEAKRSEKVTGSYGVFLPFKEIVESFSLALKFLEPRHPAKGDQRVFSLQEPLSKRESLAAILSQLSKQMELTLTEKPAVSETEFIEVPALEIPEFALEKITPDRLVSVLEGRSIYCDRVKTGPLCAESDHESVIYLVQQTLEELPLPASDVGKEDFWSALNQDQSEKILDAIYRLTRHLVVSMDSSPIAHPERVISIFKAQAIAYKLACQLEANVPEAQSLLSRYGIDITALENLSGNVHNVIYDVKTKKALEVLLKYFHALNSTKRWKLFDYGSWSKNKEREIEVPIPPKKSADYDYLLSFHKTVTDWAAVNSLYDSLQYEEQREKMTPFQMQMMFCWVGSEEMGVQPPKYFSYLRDISLLGLLIEQRRIHTFKLVGGNKALIYLREEFSHRGKIVRIIFFNREVSLARPTFSFIPTTSGELFPPNSYPETHFNVTSEDFGSGDALMMALAHKRAENDVIINHAGCFKEHFLTTTESLLLPCYMKRLMMTNLENLVNRKNQAFCNLALFRWRIQAFDMEPLQASEFLKTVDRMIEEVLLRMVECEESLEEKNAFINTKIFLWQFKMRLLDHMRDGNQIDKSDFDNEIVNTRHALKKTIGESTTLSIQRAARLTLVMSYHYLPPNKEEDFTDILECLWMGRLTSYAKEDCDPSIENQAKQLFFHYLPQIKDRLTQTFINNFFSKKLKEFYGINIGEEVQWRDQFPDYFCQVGGDTFHINMFTWRVTSNGIPLGDLSSLYNKAEYKFLFGNKRFPPCVTRVLGPYLQYEIKDSGGSLIRFVLGKESGSLIRVEKEFGGKNYVYIPWCNLSRGADWMPLPKHPNKNNYVLWLSTEESAELLIVDRRSEEVACKVQHGGDVIYKGKTYDSVDVETIEQNEVLQHFDHANNILALKKRGTEDLLLEFSRYRYPSDSVVQFLSKTVRTGGKGEKESKETRLVWSRDPQYFIAENQQVNGLSGFDHCLVLENKNGNRKVMIPLQTFLTQKSSGLKIPPFTFECELMDLSSKNTLLPKTPKQCAVAAYLSLMQHEYSRSLQYLRSAYHLQRYTPEDLKYLGWIICSKEENRDNDPNAIAIRSYALWLGQDNLFRNPKDAISQSDESSMRILPDQYKNGKFWERYWEGATHSQSESTVFDLVAETYSQYLGVRKNVNAELRIDVSRKGRRGAILKPYEEIRWLQQCLEHSPSEQIMSRLKYIAGIQATFVDIRVATPTIVLPNARFDEECFTIILGALQKKQRDFLSSRKIDVEILIKRIFPRTRPGKQFQYRFLDLYTIARSGTAKEKKLLMHFLNDMRFERNPGNQALRAILEAIVTQHEISRDIMDEVGKLSDSLFNSDSASATRMRTKICGEMTCLVQKYLKDRNITRTGSDFFIESKEVSEVVAYRPELERFPETAPSEDDRLTWVVPGESDWKGKMKISYKKAPRQKTEHPPLMDLPRKGKYEGIRFQELQDDYKIGCSKNEELEQYVFDSVNFRELLEMFRNRNDVLLRSSHSLLREMIVLANKASRGDKVEEGVMQRIAEYGRKRNRVDFPNLVGAFLQQSRRGYQRLNPSLTTQDIEELHQLVGSYILSCLEINRNNETMKPLGALTSQQKAGDPEEEENALQELGRCLDAADMQQCTQFPAFMVFEWAMQLRVRPDQVQNILTMLGIDETETKALGGKTFPNLIIQKIMGGGKTLVLGTLMSLLKADGYHLSVLIPPSSLYDTNAQDMKIRLEKTFGQKTGTVIFKRGPQQFNEIYLNGLYHTFISAIKDRDAIIVTPESLQAMQNQYIEAREELKALYEQVKTTADANDRNKISRKIDKLEKPTRILKEILRLIAERAVFTFDEVDVVLDTRKELNFPLGNRFREHPQSIELLAKLFAIAASDSDIISAGLNLAEDKQAELMPEQYEKIKKLLAQKVIIEIANSNIWCERLFLNPNIGKKFADNVQDIEMSSLEKFFKDAKLIFQEPIDHDILKGIYQTFGSSPQLSDIKQYLEEKIFKIVEEDIKNIHEYCQLRVFFDIYQYISNSNASMPEFVRKLHQSEDSSKQLAADWCVLLHQELSEWLQESWKKSADLHYGFSQTDERKRIAIPYSANNTPSERSEFADSWEMINRTLQLYISKGLSESQTIEFIKKMQQKVRSEWDRAGRSIAISEMPTAKAFKRITGRDVFLVSTIDVAHVRHVQTSLKASRERETFDFVLSFVQDEVLSKQEFYEEQINNNGQNLAAMPKAKQGYTGTIESRDTFPYDVVLYPDVGTNGKIIDVLLRRNDVVHVVKEGSVKEHLKQVFTDNPNAHRFRALIDIGPMYKGISSRQIAIDILDFMQSQKVFSQVKGVLYWDDKTKMLCCIKLGEESSPIVFPATDSDTIFSLTGLEREELFAFYPHHKITGADLAFSRDAYALTTFAEKTPLRDLLQGVMRMRGLFGVQHVETMLTTSVVPIIEERLQDRSGDSPQASGEIISIKHLISFGESVETDRQEKNFVRSVLQQVHNQLRQHVFKSLMEAKTGEEENRIYTSARHLFVKKPFGSLFEQYGAVLQNIPIENFIIQYIDSYLRPLYGKGFREIVSKEGGFLRSDKPLPKELLEVCKNIQTLISEKLARLPDTISNRTNVDWGKESTVEQLEETTVEDTREQQNECELELESSLKITPTLTPAKEKAWERGQIDRLFSQGFITTEYPEKSRAHPTTWKLSEVLKGKKNLEKYAACFSENILVTENFLATVEGECNVFDDKQKTICQVVAIYDAQCKETNPWKLILCSQKEASMFMEAIYRQKQVGGGRFNMFLLEPEGTVVQQGSVLLDSIGASDLNWLRSSLVEVLFMSGNIKALNADRWQQNLQEWGQNHSQEKRELLERVILKGDDFKSQEYEGSQLQTILYRRISQSAGKRSAPLY